MEVVALVIGVTGWFFGSLFGWKLYQWEKQLARARIAVAYKNRVKLTAPLTEWLHWAKLLAKDEQSTGRVVYRMGQTSVAILKPVKSHGKTKTRTVKEKQAA